MTQTNETPKLYGNRTCRNCKGICHENSYRRNFGERKAYYCSEACLRNSVSKKIQNRLSSKGYTVSVDEIFNDNEWTEHRNKLYEPVTVITP